MEEEFKHIVRIARKDLNGNKTIEHAITDIKGVGKAFAKAIVSVLGLDGQEKIGYLSEDDITRLEEALKNPGKYDIPHWMMNRRQDYGTGQDKHIIEADLEMSLREDLNRLKKIRSYRGIRHELGLPVRGQRTKSTFRKGQSVGVRRRKRK
ncbi:MAG TPA: 30S ribosomal protein S13 [Methanothermobacter sp.]|nr:30S ribosomal protein S13p [Methanothermobacter sp. MT-2]HHW04362.1 30S ribosomal protein S13 [Methanothermobacter sp.]HOK72404.1 30S ribosomal protein S13 [Methanothermobacter sp.]HOL69193.1 30S ribosomal protein S13 [Methanothermobacter sp.]HPQ03891.1 30S ribosomal protein S13 [Methanothermobacter sp.]